MKNRPSHDSAIRFNSPAVRRSRYAPRLTREQDPGIGDDFGLAPDDDEKLALLDLHLVSERPIFRKIPADERARQRRAAPGNPPSSAAINAAAIGPAKTTRPSSGKIRNPAPRKMPNSPPNHAPVSAPASRISAGHEAVWFVGLLKVAAHDREITDREAGLMQPPNRGSSAVA